ncbi:hypothetical protein NC652_000399 [Populus alba x Populus x berolinensis]|nr:hypothetical protein NC652_000399 [Populus alba x Populus x berolinensis]
MCGRAVILACKYYQTFWNSAFERNAMEDPHLPPVLPACRRIYCTSKELQWPFNGDLDCCLFFILRCHMGSCRLLRYPRVFGIISTAAIIRYPGIISAYCNRPRQFLWWSNAFSVLSRIKIPVDM